MANPKFGTHGSADYVAVTPHDSTDIRNGNLTRGLYVGGAGNLVAVNNNETAVTFTGVLAGTVLPIQCKRVNSTSTTATNIVALF